jgi:catechol 2,3-dioxygenase-like lactoylglutathione lyase family enzyme
MGILTLARPALIICTRDRARSAAFYRDILGLELVQEDKFAVVFSTGGVTLRVSHVADFTPHGHTILGFTVSDVAAAVRALNQQSLAFERFVHIPQDELGVWTAPGRKIQVAWFKDPDGNLLSVTNAWGEIEDCRALELKIAIAGVLKA